MKNPKYTPGGIEVTLSKDFTEFGVTFPAGKTITVHLTAYNQMLNDGFIADDETVQTSKPPVKSIKKANKNKL